MMKLAALPVLLWLFCVTVQHVGADDQATMEPLMDVFSMKTTEAEWDYCGVEYTATCEPEISIEQAACEAPLIVYGRVITIEDDPNQANFTRVQIQVDWFSAAFSGSEDKKGVPKWGAGLDIEDESQPFFGDSSFFKTWVYGFEVTPSMLGFGTTPCGTGSPFIQQSFYFFLEPRLENEGAVIAIDENADLSVDFQLSTTLFSSGYAGIEAWDLVERGAFESVNRLESCDVVYCCYNPDCEKCAAAIAAEPNFVCRYENYEVNEDGDPVAPGGDGDKSASRKKNISVSLVIAGFSGMALLFSV